jgi:translation initiation factor 1 (eIF-1/SUI1)
MSDEFVFAGFGLSNDQPADENQPINVEKELLSKPIILIDITSAKKGFETIVTGLTEQYIKTQNNDLCADELVRKFKKKKGCIGTLRKTEVDGVKTDEISLVFRGKHREDLEKFLKNCLALDDDQLKIKGLEN